MAASIVAALSNAKRSEARIAVHTLISLGLGRFGVEELHALLPTKPKSKIKVRRNTWHGEVWQNIRHGWLNIRHGEVWRNIRYGEEGHRRLQTFQGPSNSLLTTDVSVPFGERLQVVEKKAQGGDLWLKLGNGTYANKWVLAKEGTTQNCIRLSDWKDHAGRIPDSAFSGQRFPTAGMYTEGYDGFAKNICLVSASGDAFWREVNIEMLFRDLATTTVFEEQWGGDANFTDWVAYYSGNVLIFGHLRTQTPKQLVVTVKHTPRWKDYLHGCCRGPDVQAVKDDIGKAQAKECQWLHSMRQRLDLKWEEVEFVTAFTFLTKYCGWNDNDCWQAAVHKLTSLSDEWAQCMNYKKRAYLLGSAIWCVDEAFARQPEGTQLPAGESAAILKLLNSLPQTCRLELMQKEPTDAVMRWINVQSSTLALLAAECGWVEVLKVLQGTLDLCNVRGDSGRAPVHLAAKGGHREVLDLLETHKYLRDDQGQTPAYIAAECGQWVALRILDFKGARVVVGEIETQFRGLGKRADAEAIAAAETGDVVALRHLRHFHGRLREDKHCEAQARAAARNGQVEALQLLLVELGLDVDVQDSDGQSLAHDAASSAQPEILRRLLLHGANFSLEDHCGEMPAHRAASRGHVEALRVLTDGSAELNTCSREGKTLAICAAEGNHNEALQLLADKRADLNLHDSSGQAPVHYAARGVEALEALADGGADLNSRDRGGRTPTCYAAEWNQVRALQLLARRGADMNLQDSGSNAAVHYAAIEGHAEALGALADCGADLSARDKGGRTPACYAAEWNQVRALQLLAHRGADMNLQDAGSNAAVHYAAIKGHAEALGALADGGADLNAHGDEGKTPAFCAAEGNHVRVLRLLVQRRANLDLQHRGGSTAVHCAATKGHVEVLEVLADSGANLNARDRSSETPAIAAARVNKVGALRLLAYKGADLNAQKNSGDTALHHAAFFGFAEALGVLADSGANLNIRNGEGKTPAHRAAHESKAECLRVLARRGADLTVKDNRGNTLEDVARRGHSPGVLLRLLRELRAAQQQGTKPG